VVELEAALKWLAFGQQVVTAGAGALAAVKAAAAANGVQADTAAMEAVIADAERRKKLAEEDASR
jgi:hypothetical protein